MTRTRAALALGLLALACAASAVYVLPLKNALSGGGAHAYAGMAAHPENFLRDWPCGVADYRLSLPLWAMGRIVRAGLVDFRLAVALLAGFQTVFFTLAVNFLARTLADDRTQALALTALALATPLFGVNLANYGAGFGFAKPDLFYNYALAFGFCGLACVLRERLVAAAALLAGAVASHVGLGLMAAGAAGCAALALPDIWRRRSTWLAVALFAVPAGAWTLHVLGAVPPARDLIPDQDWIDLGRVYNYHWFPLARGFFTISGHRLFLPVLILGLVPFVLDRAAWPVGNRVRGTLAAMAGCLGLTALGVVVSDVVPVPMLLAFSPQRASGLATALGLLLLGRVLLEQADAFAAWRRLLAVYTLLCMAAFGPGLALLPLGLVLATLPAGPGSGSSPARAVGLILTAAVCLALVAQAAAAFGPAAVAEPVRAVLQWWPPLATLNPAGPVDMVLRGGVAALPNLLSGNTVWALTGVLAAGLALVPGQAGGIRRTVLAVVLVAAAAGLHVAGDLSWLRDNRERAESFREAQTWAREHTPANALFLTNPAYGDGWKEFSWRSHFGFFQSWAYDAACYSRDVRVLAEGVRRATAFGVESDPRREPDLPATVLATPGGFPDRQKARLARTFEALDGPALADLCRRFGIDYVVVDKTARPGGLDPLMPVHDNGRFLVLAVPAQEPAKP